MIPFSMEVSWSFATMRKENVSRCGGNHENRGGGLLFKRPRMCVIQTGRETKKFKMAPATFYNHLIS